MSYVVPDKVFDKEQRQEHSDARIDEVENIVAVLSSEPGSERLVDVFDADFQNNRRKTAKKAHPKGQEQHQVAFRHPVKEVFHREESRPNPKFRGFLHLIEIMRVWLSILSLHTVEEALDCIFH